MTAPRTETTPKAKAVVPPQKVNPPVGGGSTTMMLATLHGISQSDLKAAPLLAKKPVTGSRFGQLREQVDSYSLASQGLIQQLDDDISLMSKSKEAQKLGMSLAPFRDEAIKLLETLKALKDSIRQLDAHFDNKLNEYETLIKENKTRPTEIEPIISELQRTQKRKLEEFEQLKRNDKYELSKVQPIASQVQFHAVAYRSEMVMRGEMPTPQSGR